MMANSNPEPTPMRTFAKKSKLDEEARKPTIIVYYCYYCDAGSLTLDIVRAHWRSFHMNEDDCTMFKYREIAEAQVKCAYCAETGTKAMLVNHIWESHGKNKPLLFIENEEEGWMCKWLAFNRYKFIL